jgi:hypothetical protein
LRISLVTFSYAASSCGVIVLRVILCSSYGCQCGVIFLFLCVIMQAVGLVECAPLIVIVVLILTK